MENLEYIASYLGLDIDNKLIFKDIAEIENKIEFIDFMKANIKHTSLSYMNALQKLTQLKTLYNQELNKDREQEAQTQSQLLEEKFREIKPMIKNEHLKGLQPTLNQIRINGTNYFTKFEESKLNAIGEVKYLVSLSDSHKLQENIEKVFLQEVYKVKQIGVKKESRQLKLNVKRI